MYIGLDVGIEATVCTHSADTVRYDFTVSVMQGP